MDLEHSFSLVAHELNKSREVVVVHYQELVRNIEAIESRTLSILKSHENAQGSENVNGNRKDVLDPSSLSMCTAETEADRAEGKKKTKKKRKRGKPWTTDEHKLFLRLVEELGRGDWRGIARRMGTRTASQVGSHAQKYFIRQENAGEKVYKRRSIHDTTS